MNIITIKVQKQNLHTGNISVDSSLNIIADNKHFNWMTDVDSSDKIRIERGSQIVEVESSEVSKNINKLIKPLNSIKQNISTYIININDILKLSTAVEVSPFE